MSTATEFSAKVFEFKTFQEFLKSYCKWEKQRSNTWTLTKWVNQLGLKATTSISMVIYDQRKCGRKIEDSLVTYFQFTTDQERHFRLLVKKSRARAGDPTLPMIEDEIKKSQIKKEEQKLCDSDDSELFHWLTFAIRQIARSKPLTTDVNAIQEKLHFPATVNEISIVLENLVKRNLIHKSANGYVNVSRPLTTNNIDMGSKPIQQLQEQIIDLAKKSVQTFQPEKRELQARVLKVAPEDIGKAKELIRKFQEDFDSLLDNPNASSAFQLSIQFFPLGDN